MKLVFFLSCLVVALAQTADYEPLETDSNQQFTEEPETVTDMSDFEAAKEQMPNPFDSFTRFFQILGTPWNNLTEEQRTTWEGMFDGLEEVQMILNGFGITPKMVHGSVYLMVSNAKLSKIQDELQLMLDENPRFAVFFSFFYSTVQSYGTDLEVFLRKGILTIENTVRSVSGQDMGVHEFVRDLATALDDQLPRHIQNVFGPQFGTFVGKTFAFFLDNLCKEMGTIDVSDEEYVSPKDICTTVDQALRVVMGKMYHEIADNRNKGNQLEDFKVKYNTTEFNSGY